MQRNWIGEGSAEVEFTTRVRYAHIFTTRPDTLWGATFMVMAPEHPFVEKLVTAKHDGCKSYTSKKPSARPESKIR